MSKLSPLARGLSALIIMGGALVCTNRGLLIAAWICLAAAAAGTGVLRTHLRLTLAFVVRIILGSILINGLLPDLHAIGRVEHRLLAAVPGAVMLGLRLGVIAACTHVCMLPLLRDEQLVRFLRAWGFSVRGVLVVSAAVTFFAEFSIRGRQVFDARLAQGLGAARWAAFTQLPLLLMPLFVSIVDSASIRAELWQNRNLVHRLASYQKAELEFHSALTGGVCIAVSSIWCAAALCSRLN